MEPNGTASSSCQKLEGRYANYFSVGHNSVEFVLDIGQFYAENNEARIHTRIITSPTYAKSLLETLRVSVETYEQEYGTISSEGES